MSNYPSLLSKIQGTLLGVMIGDALGMPVETMKPDAITTRLGPQGVTTFLDAIQIRVKESTQLKAGDTTDDWQLTKVVAESLISAKGFNIDDCVAKHMVAYHTSQTGWGRATRESLRDIKDGKRDITQPIPHVPGTGGGNGVIMKIAPLAIMSACIKRNTGTYYLLHRNVYALGKITHSDSNAWDTAFIIALLMERILLAEDWYTTHELKEELVSMLFLPAFKKQYEPLIPPHLEKIVRDAITTPLGKHGNEHVEVRTRWNPGFLAIESMPFVLSTFLRHSDDFRKGVLEAVNAGGDADTHASIVGALIGAHVGIEGIPHEWRTFRKEFIEALALGEKLHQTFMY